MYFPQLLNWFDDLSSPMTAAFVERWPTLADAQKEEPEQWREFFHAHGSRSEARIEQRLREISTGNALVTDAAVVEPAVFMVKTLLAVVAVLSRGIDELDGIIAKVAMAHPDYAIFSSFPAAGPVMAPRLLAAFGSQRERYQSAKQLQSFSGIAPVTQKSGPQKWVHFRWACPKFLRQTFPEYAALTIPRCPWAKAFYDRQRANQKGHHAAVRALAYKWQRILFRCWQSRQPYDADQYLAACQQRATPVEKPSALPTPVIRQSIAGACGKQPGFRWKTAGEILKSLLADA